VANGGPWNSIGRLSQLHDGRKGKLQKLIWVMLDKNEVGLLSKELTLFIFAWMERDMRVCIISRNGGN
jgi:hypothetical protein